MSTTDLVYVGFLHRVAALDRLTGRIVWQWEAANGRGYLTLLLDRGVLIVSSNGYMYGLDAASGRELWYNPMKGFGSGVASLASANGSAQNVAGNAAASAAAAHAVATQPGSVGS